MVSFLSFPSLFDEPRSFSSVSIFGHAKKKRSEKRPRKYDWENGQRKTGRNTLF
jgi:hypothetical protein